MVAVWQYAGGQARVAFAGFSGQAYAPAGDKSRYVLPPLFRKAVRESSDGRVLCLAKHDRWSYLVRLYQALPSLSPVHFEKVRRVSFQSWDIFNLS